MKIRRNDACSRWWCQCMSIITGYTHTEQRHDAEDDALEKASHLWWDWKSVLLQMPSRVQKTRDQKTPTQALIWDKHCRDLATQLHSLLLHILSHIWESCEGFHYEWSGWWISRDCDYEMCAVFSLLLPSGSRLCCGSSYDCILMFCYCFSCSCSSPSYVPLLPEQHTDCLFPLLTSQSWSIARSRILMQYPLQPLYVLYVYTNSFPLRASCAPVRQKQKSLFFFFFFLSLSLSFYTS